MAVSLPYTAAPFDTPHAPAADQQLAEFNVRRVAIAALVTGCLLFLADHDWSISRYEDFTASSADMEAGAAAGNAIRSAAIFSLGALAGISLLVPGGYSLCIRGLMALLMIAAVGWCAASVLWSIEPAIAVRRLIASGCLAVAAVAAAKWLRLRELAVAALACALAYLMVGLLAELALGTFQPWRADYRFAGTLHPNNQGLNGALIFMAAAYLAQSGRQHRKFFWMLAAVGLVELWVTKSRTPLAALVVAQLLYWFITASWRGKIIGGAAAVGITCLVILVAGDATVETVGNAALMGAPTKRKWGHSAAACRCGKN